MTVNKGQALLEEKTGDIYYVHIADNELFVMSKSYAPIGENTKYRFMSNQIPLNVMGLKKIRIEILSDDINL